MVSCSSPLGTGHSPHTIWEKLAFGWGKRVRAWVFVSVCEWMLFIWFNVTTCICSWHITQFIILIVLFVWCLNVATVFVFVFVFGFCVCVRMWIVKPKISIDFQLKQNEQGKHSFWRNTEAMFISCESELKSKIPILFTISKFWEKQSKLLNVY